MAACLLAVPLTVEAQEHHTTSEAHSPSHSRLSVGASGIVLVTNVSPAHQGRGLTEVYLTQPMAMARWPVARFHTQATLNLEDLTLRRGELGPGIYGEGYVDRRHPHTLLHELMVTTEARTGAVAWSLAVGRGFAPFGSDDPMVRPFVKYPVNHHLAQILERTVVVAAARAGPLALEAARFNGDEPEGSRDMPAVDRFGDSWSARLTLWPLRGMELSAGRAYVASPEDAGGRGPNQQKSHVGLRYAGDRERLYVLLEFAQTRELDGDRQGFEYTSLLAEGGVAVGPLHGALRVERTTRPDEERLADPFRTPRPLLDFRILGRSRWDVISAALSTNGGSIGAVGVRPFIEAQYARVKATIRPTVFEPAHFYGDDRLWTLSAGVRVQIAHGPGRAGRYGVAMGRGNNEEAERVVRGGA